MFCKDNEKFVFIMTSADTCMKVITRRIDVLTTLMQPAHRDVEFNIKTLVVFADCTELLHVVREFRYEGQAPYQQEEWLDAKSAYFTIDDAHRIYINRYPV